MPTPINVSEEQRERDLRAELSSYITYDTKCMRKHAKEAALNIFFENFDKGDLEHSKPLFREASRVQKGPKAWLAHAYEDKDNPLPVDVSLRYPYEDRDITNEHTLVQIASELNRAAEAIEDGALVCSEANARAVCRMMLRFPNGEPISLLPTLKAFELHLIKNKESGVDNMDEAPLPSGWRENVLFQNPFRGESPELLLGHMELIKSSVDDVLHDYHLDQGVEYAITDNNTDAFRMSLVYNKEQMIAFAQATLVTDHCYDIISDTYSLDAEYNWDKCISGFYDSLEDVIGTYRAQWKEIALECAFENGLSMGNVLVSLGTDGDYKKQQNLMKGFGALDREQYLEVLKRVREGSITDPIPVGNMEKWLWKMDYCKENGLAPAQAESWKAADDAWVEKDSEPSLGM